MSSGVIITSTGGSGEGECVVVWVGERGVNCCFGGCGGEARFVVD